MSQSIDGDAGRHRFVALDGLRGVAALMVLVLHGVTIFPSSVMAVDLFFMLSGFVLAHAYGERLDSAAERVRFVKARLIRLWPLYLVGCLIALPAAIGMTLFGWSYWTPTALVLSILTAPFFILLPYDSYTIPLNPPGWSLSFELIANAVFLFVGIRWRWVIAIVGISAPLLLLGIYLYTGGTTGWHSFAGAFPRTFFSFFAGVLLFRLWQGQWLPRLSLPAVLLMALLVLMCALAPRQERSYSAFVLFLFNPALIWLGASSVARGVVARLCTWLGDISYALYVLHAPVIMSVEGLRFLMLSGSDAATYTPDGSTAPITLPIAIGLAHLLTYRWDTPLRRRLTARYLRKPA
ncbi:acyltransferase [Sphingomonas sp. BGYR3]|uniref:acyltransferase family protein n=1 Tax=Sphingomonas sp. BGYR3 TaxID=2975483 RepID=UPI0021A8F22B|nr:acyltransferase [Sphingomonas sp. BGYR3]